MLLIDVFRCKRAKCKRRKKNSNPKSRKKQTLLLAGRRGPLQLDLGRYSDFFLAADHRLLEPVEETDLDQGVVGGKCPALAAQKDIDRHYPMLCDKLVGLPESPA